MKFCLCTLYDDNFKNFIDPVKLSFKKFCRLNNFDFIYFDKLFDINLHPSWNKLLAIQECFNRHYEYVFWCDADSIFINTKNLFLDSISFFNQELILNHDSNGICMSHFLIKNNDYNNKLLNTLLFLGDVKDDKMFGIGKKWEQNCLKHLINGFTIKYDLFPKDFVVDYVYHNRYYNNTQFYHFSILDNIVRTSLIQLLTEKIYGN